MHLCNCSCYFDIYLKLHLTVSLIVHIFIVAYSFFFFLLQVFETFLQFNFCSDLILMLIYWFFSLFFKVLHPFILIVKQFIYMKNSEIKFNCLNSQFFFNISFTKLLFFIYHFLVLFHSEIVLIFELAFSKFLFLFLQYIIAAQLL